MQINAITLEEKVKRGVCQILKSNAKCLEKRTKKIALRTYVTAHASSVLGYFN